MFEDFTAVVSHTLTYRSQLSLMFAIIILNKCIDMLIQLDRNQFKLTTVNDYNITNCQEWRQLRVSPS